MTVSQLAARIHHAEGLADDVTTATSCRGGVSLGAGRRRGGLRGTLGRLQLIEDRRTPLRLAHKLDDDGL